MFRNRTVLVAGTDTSGNLMLTTLDPEWRLNIGILPAPNA